MGNSLRKQGTNLTLILVFEKKRSLHQLIFNHSKLKYSPIYNYKLYLFLNFGAISIILLTYSPFNINMQKAASQMKCNVFFQIIYTVWSYYEYHVGFYDCTLSKIGAQKPLNYYKLWLTKMSQLPGMKHL